MALDSVHCPDLHSKLELAQLRGSSGDAIICLSPSDCAADLVPVQPPAVVPSAFVRRVSTVRLLAEAQLTLVCALRVQIERPFPPMPPKKQPNHNKAAKPQPQPKSTTKQAASSSSASSVSNRSPAARCHPDVLSVVFSFLPLPLFARAARVCRSWHQACSLQSSWPSLVNLPTPDSLQRRQARLNFDFPGSDVASSIASPELDNLLRSLVWRRVQSLRFDTLQLFDEDPINAALIPRCAELPNLTSVSFNFSCQSLAEEQARDLMLRMRNRIQSLELGETADFMAQELTAAAPCLRSLTCQRIDAATVLQLRALERLVLTAVPTTLQQPLLMRAVRVLSSRYRLREISVYLIDLPALVDLASTKRIGHLV